MVALRVVNPEPSKCEKIIMTIYFIVDLTWLLGRDIKRETEAGISAGIYYYEWTKSLFPGWNFVWLGFWLWEMKWILALLTKQIENEVDIYFGNID